MEKTKLSFSSALGESFSIAMKHAGSIIGCLFLWLITIWIPWLNVGTTIAIMSIPVELSNGNMISPGSIFNAKYRRRFGDVFMLMGLTFLPIILATAFMVLPGIILSVGWMLAIYLILEKNMSPLKALRASYDATDGNKLNIFMLQLVIGIIMGIAGGLLGWVADLIAIDILTIIIGIIFFIFAMLVSLGIEATVYRRLKGNVVE